MTFKTRLIHRCTLNMLVFLAIMSSLTLDVALISGFSPAILKSVINGKDFTPYGILRTTINNKD